MAAKKNTPVKIAGRKVAVIHDWLNGMRGGELVLEAMLEYLTERAGVATEDIEIFTLIYDEKKVSDFIRSFKVNTSYIRRFPFAKNKYRSYLPFFPSAIEAFDLSGFELVLSSSHCVAKGVIVPTDVAHLSYVHSPMRYVWDLYYDYFPPKKTGLISRLLIRYFSGRLRLWDSASASRVSKFISNSNYIGLRIRRFFGKPSHTIYPPCGTMAEFKSRFEQNKKRSKDDYYLLVTAFAPYKRTDLAIAAFKENGLPLVIIGSGQDEKALKKQAAGADNIEFLGNMPRDTTLDYMARARGFIYPGIEDFGIALVEAQSFATPVIAYARGGALESVLGGKTGVFFTEQTVSALQAAVSEVENKPRGFKAVDFYNNITRFSKERFLQEYETAVTAAVHEWQAN